MSTSFQSTIICWHPSDELIFDASGQLVLRTLGGGGPNFARAHNRLFPDSELNLITLLGREQEPLLPRVCSSSVKVKPVFASGKLRTNVTWLGGEEPEYGDTRLLISEIERALFLAAASSVQPDHWHSILGSLPEGVSAFDCAEVVGRVHAREAFILADTRPSILHAMLNCCREAGYSPPNIVRLNLKELKKYAELRRLKVELSVFNLAHVARLVRLLMPGVIAIISLGKPGLLAVTPRRAKRIWLDLEDPLTINPVGCGDSTDAAILGALNEGCSIVDACILGNCAGFANRFSPDPEPGVFDAEYALSLRQYAKTEPVDLPARQPARAQHALRWARAAPRF